MTAAVTARALSKHFGDVRAVDDLNIEIADGEFFSMLGPSGSGKTTVLRLIAGFEQPSGGRVLLGETDVTDQPPYRRDVNTVFQDYAIFPHMDVVTNVEYSLRVKKVDVVAAVLVLISAIPIYFAQRLSGDVVNSSAAP